MNENAKSAIFVIAAVIAVAGAVLGRPGRVGEQTPDQVGQPLFPEFQDPSVAENLRIVSMDSDKGTIDEFSIAKKQGQWVIPSHNDYPADATENLTIAATVFVGLDVVDVAGDQKKLHTTFGVVEPSEENSNEEGLGKLVSMTDGKGNRLVELVIGKSVKGEEGQHYVRIPGQDRIYTVELDPSKLSTRFEDWVQQDVLQIASTDIAQMRIRDYSVTPFLSRDGRLSVEKDQRLQIDLSWNADEFEWDLDELLEFRGDELYPTELLDTEQLDKARLDEMKNAIAELKIVDVSPKPPLLRDGLREGETEIWNDREGVQSLLQRGFFPAATPDGQIELVSSDGEASVITTDGVEITLRFGGIAGAESDGGEISQNRYVMITAAVHEESFPKPQLEDLPTVEGDPATDDGDADDAKDEPEAKDDAPDDNSDADEESADDATDDANSDADSDDSEAPSKSEQERDQVAKENQRKLDEYNDKRKVAVEKVGDLNFRFADWYYVISEEVYKDVHLARKDIISASAATLEDGFGIDAFRKLETEALQREDEDQAESEDQAEPEQ